MCWFGATGTVRSPASGSFEEAPGILVAANDPSREALRAEKHRKVTVIIFPSCQNRDENNTGAFLLIVNKRNCGIIGYFTKSIMKEKKQYRVWIVIAEIEFLSGFVTVDKNSICRHALIHRVCLDLSCVIRH